LNNLRAKMVKTDYVSAILRDTDQTMALKNGSIKDISVSIEI